MLPNAGFGSELDPDRTQEIFVLQHGYPFAFGTDAGWRHNPAHERPTPFPLGSICQLVRRVRVTSDRYRSCFSAGPARIVGEVEAHAYAR